MTRVAVYVDGFNLYHAIDDLKKPELKWLNIRLLAMSLCRDHEFLLKVSYFSAFATWLPDEYFRHRQYVAALNASNVECHMARFSEKNAHCRHCGARWKTHEEKETDVHISMMLVEDAFDDVFDRAIVISADSDHVPAIRRVRLRWPEKEVSVATPPQRHGRARELLKVSSSAVPITPGRLARCLLPDIVSDSSGKVVATRPLTYAPRA